MDPEIKALFELMIEGQNRTSKLLLEAQNRTDKVVGELAGIVGMNATTMTDTFAKTDAAIAKLAATVDQYVQAADARMKRIEENLDGLIRAIANEHSNGKARP